MLNIGDVIFTVSAFIILMLLLKKYALKPIIKVVEKRQDDINREIDESEAREIETNKLLNEQKKLLEESRIEINRLRDINKEELEIEREKARAATLEELKNMKEATLKELEKEKEKMIYDSKSEIINSSFEIAKSILEKEIDEEKQKDIIKKVLDNAK